MTRHRVPALLGVVALCAITTIGSTAPAVAQVANAKFGTADHSLIDNVGWRGHRYYRGYGWHGGYGGGGLAAGIAAGALLGGALAYHHHYYQRPYYPYGGYYAPAPYGYAAPYGYEYGD